MVCVGFYYCAVDTAEYTNFRKRYGTEVQMNYNKLQKYLENSGTATIILSFDTLTFLMD